MTIQCALRIGPLARAAGLITMLTLLPALSWACTVSSTGMAFGSYNPFDDLPTDSTAFVRVECETAYNIALSQGQAATFHPRAMAGASDTLQYNLFTAADYSVTWGDGSGGTQVVSGPGEAQSVEHVVYGRSFARQNSRVGSYADTITVTLEF